MKNPPVMDATARRWRAALFLGRVAAVSTAGYAAFLVGPPSLGFLADHVGLRNAMVVVLVLLGGAALITRALRTPAFGAGEEPPGASAPGARQSDLV